MPYLSRSQVNTAATLAIHPVDDTGHLYDPATVEFRIIDLSDNSQVFPVSGYEDVTTDGRVDTGVYYAFDTGTATGWAPKSDATVGAHRIDWRFTDADNEVVTRTWSQRFDVYTAGVEIPYWTYVTPNDVRVHADSSMISDARVVELIERVQQYIERECRQPFRPVRHTIKFDGNGGLIFPCPVPIIGVDELMLNYSTSAASHDSYEVYNATTLSADPGWRPRDNRKNPKIKLHGGRGSIFDMNGSTRFIVGTRPHSLKGVFGYVEPDGNTPALIRDAALRVVMATAVTMDVGPGGSGGAVAGPITSEKTDQHEVSYAFSYTAGSLDSALATSPEVLDILRRYQAPPGIASPGTNWASLITR